MKVYFASDHAGFELKHGLINFVRGELNHDVEDCGPSKYDAADDYPPLIAEAIRALQLDLQKGMKSRAVILGGSGEGEAIVANRFAGIRAAVFYGGDTGVIKLSRKHNDSNCLSLGARFISQDEAKAAVRLWLLTPFSEEERHVRRIAQIEHMRRGE